ncbi:hypothetical protein, partial [Streptomyces heilongjiangensis]
KVLLLNPAPIFCAIIHTQTSRQADKQTNREADKQRGRQTERQTNREADKQRGRQTDKLNIMLAYKYP